MWPGNNIPTFKNNEVMLKQLDKLVKSLLPDCEMPFFGEQAIRRHILDSLTERRRQIKKGHNYENVSTLLHSCLHSIICAYITYVAMHNLTALFSHICIALTIKKNQKGML